MTELIPAAELGMACKKSWTGKFNDVFQDIVGSLYSRLTLSLAGGKTNKNGYKIKITFMVTNPKNSILVNSNPSLQTENMCDLK